MKTNYHTHTTRCQHAAGEDEEYVQAALRAGFEELGFADHAPWPFQNGFVSRIRMGLEDLPGYIQSVQALRERYAGQISVRLGLESEYFPRYHDHLLRMRDAGVSYYVLGQHYADSEEDHPYVGDDCRTDAGVMRYAEAVVRGMETGLFAYVAHPDLFMRHRRRLADDAFDRTCEEASDMICQAALSAHMPLEYNLLGLLSQLEGHDRGYPDERFWSRARRWGNQVIIGVDAHEPGQLENQFLWRTGESRVNTLGLERVERLP